MPGRKYNEAPTPDEEALWSALIAHQDHPFRTAKHLEFTYAIVGNEMFVSRKDKSITRATVNMAYHAARRIQDKGQTVEGPKMLGTFGASYLYPIFIRLGVIRREERQMSLWDGFPKTEEDLNGQGKN